MKEGTAAVRARDRHLWNQVRPYKPRRTTELPRGCRTFLLEIFASAAILTQVAYQDWGLPVSNPVDLNTGFDLLSQRKDDRPSTASSTRPLRHLLCSCLHTVDFVDEPLLTGEARNKVTMTRKKWQPVIKWMYEIVERRLHKGRHVLVENPWNSAKHSQNLSNKGL